MFHLLQKKKLAEDTYLIEIEAPEIARKAKPGQFIILRINEKGERIPLTIADKSKKTITIVFLAVGKTTKILASMKKGDSINDVVGPLGNPTNIKEYGTVCLVAGGLGIAPIYLIAKALKEAKNHIITIIGAKSKKHLFWEEKLKGACDVLFIATDDGSKGKKGLVSDVLKQVMEEEKINLVMAIGPTIMMKVISDITRNKVKTIVSLNPIMIDGIGMCGCCRVTVNNKTKFACCDGPEFDGHKVEWDELINRNNSYRGEEKKCQK